MEEDREIADLGPTVSADLNGDVEAIEKKPRRKFIGRKAAEANAAARAVQNGGGGGIEDSGGAIQVAPRRRPGRALNNVPDDILHDVAINEAIALLPSNYSFELHKTIHRIRTSDSRKISLQMPEGLLMFATTISDILTQFCPGISTLIMGDVTYGACCIDDYTARALGCDLLVHYAHSCLIPVNVTSIKTLYVFVDIQIDTDHLLATISRNFQPGSTIALVGTIQFNATLHSTAPLLRSAGYQILIPQITPLSKGEILGCTSPDLSKHPDPVDLLLYLGDGRFHLESHDPQPLPARLPLRPVLPPPDARDLRPRDAAPRPRERFAASAESEEMGADTGQSREAGEPAYHDADREPPPAERSTVHQLAALGDFPRKTGHDGGCGVLGAGRMSAAEYRLGVCVFPAAVDAA
ncbi:Diphthamide biosynthesis protein 1 [Friedmanniomyces endolithicus]|uniref:2-(3-amino-3-carboxypropyl)histidine synthase subunit 1 n=1 Tax=Friedmanniomyces endolithicus TaxID=329885 RepID=A0AAN6L3J3_9PEZI|nr:Diphthamide biosynthesis protein 1 [Friedmanniomyces endolithicus]KAK0981051.1 Diphthamide biosynthesis protein 1 [Friedmanniomyces endolithicus]KAK1013259.1 Diphthamide biosynthesis protein 1 [Friedmanniomyces endolithicus]